MCSASQPFHITFPETVRVRGRLLLVALTLCATIAFSAHGADLTAAQNLLLKGRYEEAREAFAEESEINPAAAIGLMRCHEEVGKRERAAEEIAAAVKRFPSDAKVRAEQSRLALDQGDLKLAELAVNSARDLDENSITARFVQAELARLNGKLDEAQQAWLKIIAVMNRLETIKDPYELRIIAQAAARYARYGKSTGLFARIINDVYATSLKRNERFWPAHFDSCLLFQEKYNEADAADQLQAALAIHPRAAELHAAQASLLVDKFDLPRARAAIKRSLEARDDLLLARQLEADTFIAEQSPAAAIALLEKAIELQPHSLETKGRLLACFGYLDGGIPAKSSPRMSELLKPLDEKPTCLGEVYYVAAEACDRMRHFALAEAFYSAALEKLPQHIYIRGGLGLSLMRLGDEPRAAKLLDEAFQLDPFNVRVKNTLEVLDVLQNYAVLETEHFVLKFDRGQSELVAKYAAEVLEDEIYPQITKELGFAPPQKTLIEFFSRAKNTKGHGWFSARMVGLPFIGTIGACAGKMVAMVSPDELGEKINWARVLRHEFVHVVNLQQTDFRIPHWLTEGLAVHLEDQPRPADWNKILLKRAEAGDLFELDNITFGFIRPSNHEDWTLAYCQSEIYVDYIRHRFGGESIAKLLAALANRKSIVDAIQETLGVNQKDFDAGYDKFLAAEVDKLRTPTAPHARPIEQLLKSAEDNRADARSAAILARAYLEKDNRPQARRWAKLALEKDKQQMQAAYVLARFARLVGDDDEALTLLRPAIEVEPADADALGLLAELLTAANDLAGAEKCYERGRKAFPADDRWLKGLARIYLSNKDDAKLAPILAQLAAKDGDNLPMRKKLAQLSLAAKDHAVAYRWATDAMFLNLRDATTHALRGSAALGLEKYELAERELRLAVSLDGSQPTWRADQIRALVKLKKTAEAEIALGDLNKAAPDFADLEELKKLIKTK
ncbi:tetratricopeptide repeat protein [Anatilimnocola floriformis]|uniref:tetratricopeptide repeat protein n=1 Tax=Anatilimnocola floriformis TaxID=2948575 RepID=UPI0020C26339|nr:tetratricopeptide repeat protein [Anatilimnocola floriformis]